MSSNQAFKYNFFQKPKGRFNKNVGTPLEAYFVKLSNYFQFDLKKQKLTIENLDWFP